METNDTAPDALNTLAKAIFEHAKPIRETIFSSLWTDWINTPYRNVWRELAAFSLLWTKPLNALADECHAANAKWWRDPTTDQPITRNKGELLMLIVSEISEAMEGERRDLMDDHLPHRRMAEVELADALIRIFDYAGAYHYDLDGAVKEKRAYNAARDDHKAESRLRAGGKQW